MFGMGFTEILLIAVIAILFLGPDKLPSTMIEIAKFFRSVKNTIGSVKESLEEEMNVTGIKQEALAYKEELLKASEGLHKVTNAPASLGAEINHLLDDDLEEETAAPKAKKSQKEPQEVTFKKKKKKKRKNLEEKPEEKEDNTDV
ncbi:MAG: Sec-independent protein translocase subunit TatB [Epsilonproteobacteria bacterium]|nr:Sec-independent protein translocase subunit TatB [Campylobacterota bacterium]